MQPVRTATAKTISQVITTRVSRENCHDNCRDTLCHNFVGFYHNLVEVWGWHEREKTGFQKPEKLQVAALLVLIQYFLPKILL